MSLDLYMSERSLVMGTLPMVFLKNTSSMVDGPTERSAGSSRSNLPKRHGWVGYLEDTRGVSQTSPSPRGWVSGSARRLSVSVGFFASALK